MEVNDTRNSLLTKELKLQNNTLGAEVSTESTSASNAVNVDSITFKDEWTKNTFLFTNTKVEKIESTSVADLVKIPDGIVYDSVNETLTFVDDSLKKYSQSGCNLDGENTVTLKELVSDITLFEALDKINNFGDVYDFQFRQVDFSTHRFSNVKSSVTFEKIIGYFSIDKLLNDELIRKNNQNALSQQYANTDRAAEFPPYSGFLVSEQYLSSGWVSLDQIIKNAYKDDNHYENNTSIAIRTPKIKEAKRALILLTMSYVCDIFNLNSFNKLSDFGIRIFDKSTGQELSVTNTKIELIDKIATTLTASYSGKLPEPDDENADFVAQLSEDEGKSCAKVKKNKCDGTLFTTSNKQNSNIEETGFIHEIDAQVRLNPFKQLLSSKPDILNSIDPIHWTTGVDNLSQIGELFSLVREFGNNTYKSGKLNNDRAFAYGSGDFNNGIAVGGYSHTSVNNEDDLETLSKTESWNGISWTTRTDAPIAGACGLAGGNQDLAVISYGINNTWTSEDKTIDKFFIPSENTILTKSAVFQNNTWKTIEDISPALPRHSVAGKLNIKYDDSVPGNNIETVYDKNSFFICNEAISQAKQIAAQKFNFSTESGSLSGNVLTPNTDPKVWFDIWQCNGIAFGGSTSDHVALDEISDSIIKDDFENISWTHIVKNTSENDTNELTTEEYTFGCWFIDPVRKYPLKAFGISYVGDNNSGIATGGKTSNSLSNSVKNNVKVNLKNYYFDPDKYNNDNLSVIPYCYENNGISWIRREDLPESVYYHTGVGNNEYALFFGGLHASLENPQVYTAFKNCQDWETLINLYGGAFARNGAYTINGNIRFTSFANIYDEHSAGGESAFGNTYYKTRDYRNTVDSTVIYSQEYKDSGNETVDNLYPNFDFINDNNPEFTFPNKQIYAKTVSRLIYTYPTYIIPSQFTLMYDLLFENDYLKSLEDLSVDYIAKAILVFVDPQQVDAVKNYFATNNYVLTEEKTLIKTTSYSEGINRVISLNTDNTDIANKQELDIFEDQLSGSVVKDIGKFTYFLLNNSKLFSEVYANADQPALPYGTGANRENYFSLISPSYSENPSEGGMWLVSRPSIGEILFDPKAFLNNTTTYDDIVNHGLNKNDRYSFFVEGAIYETLSNGEQKPNYRACNLVQYTDMDDSDDYFIGEVWRNNTVKNTNLFVEVKKQLYRDGYRGTEFVPITTIAPEGTESIGKFTYTRGNLHDSLVVFLNDQFNSPNPNSKIGIIQMYDNDYTGFLGDGSQKTSSIRDKAGLWPWVDLLKGDPSNDCVKGAYTFKWDVDGSLYYARVKEVETHIDQTTNQQYKKESITITKYLNTGVKDFEYTIEYTDLIVKTNIESLYDKVNNIVLEGTDIDSLNAQLENQGYDFRYINLFGNSIKRQKIERTLNNSLHIYGNKQNYELLNRTVMSTGWKLDCLDYYTPENISTYPFKFENLCELIKENDFYNSTDRYQIYLEGYGYGESPISITPLKPWYKTPYTNENTALKTIIPPQILTEELCGIRENLIKMRYYDFKLAPHSAVLYGDIRVMGEDLDKCYMPYNCSVISCGDEPKFNKDYGANRGQPEYYMDSITRGVNLDWKTTAIATEFTSNLYARFKRDAAGGIETDENFLINNDLIQYPNTYKDTNNVLWSPYTIANNPLITDRTLDKKPNVVVFCGGVFDVMYDKNFFETIYFLEEIAKTALENKIWFIFLTIPPRAMMQYDVAIERHVWYNNLVGGGRIDDPVGQVRMSIKEYPISGDDWNVPMQFGPYAGLSDPFIGKTKLEKIVAINEWMKSKLGEYGHTVLDLYDHFADKTSPATDQQMYIFNTENNSISGTNLPVYGFIKDEYTNGRFVNDELGQFNGLITTSGNRAMMQFVYDNVDLIPRLTAKILKFNDTITSPRTIFADDFANLSEWYGDNLNSYFDLHKVGVEDTYLSEDKLSAYNSDDFVEQVKLNHGESGKFTDLIHKECYESLYFDLLCCLLKQDTCFASCYQSMCDSLGDNKDNIKYKWKQHNHEEWTVPILESPFAGPFSTDEFNVWLASGDVKGNRWGTNIWVSDEGGVITIHHRKQRIGINDPMAGYTYDTNWSKSNSTVNRRHLYFASLTSEVQITNLETMEFTKPTACRVFYDEFIFDLDAYLEIEGFESILYNIIKISYPNNIDPMYNFLKTQDTSSLVDANNLSLKPYDINTKYEVLGLECDENASAYRPQESQLNPYATGKNLCGNEAFSYAEWVTSFVQEMKNNVSLRKLVDQKENKYFLKYDINRPFGSTTYKNSEVIELTEDIKVVETEWRRYQDGVGLGGDAPLLNVTTDNKLSCNTLNTWYLGQSSFGTPDRAIVFGGFAFSANGTNNSSHLWWENLTSNLTFKWNKFVINPEDTFNSNYSRRLLSSNFTNKEPTTAKSSLGMVLFDLTNNILVERHGTAIFDKQNLITVTVDLPEIIVNKDKYSITLTPSDNINCWWENKSANAFTIRVDAEEWSGSVEWFITLNDKVNGTEIDKDPHTPFETYEEI